MAVVLAVLAVLAVLVVLPPLQLVCGRQQKEQVRVRRQ